MSVKAVILIPARFESSRFPGKPLSKILGISMIQRVYENVAQSGFPTYVVTDDSRIDDHVKSFAGNVLRVDDKVETGSERIYLAYERYLKKDNVDLVVNVQGDEPLLKGEEVKRLIQFHHKSSFDMATMVKKRTYPDPQFHNPNVVKAIYSEVKGQCLYFSRGAIPFDRDQKNLFDWFQHIGVYSYRTSALEEFQKLPMSYYESLEKLEQLRALENGFTIGAVPTTLNLIGVDVPEDISRVERLL
ncbi:MAG: 3-deoxy-manno-octulosonate cytidylyltransferase [Bacteriovoracaceae bacterium]